MKDYQHLVYKDVSSPVGFIRLVATASGLAVVLWESEKWATQVSTHINAAPKSMNHSSQ